MVLLSPNITTVAYAFIGVIICLSIVAYIKWKNFTSWLSVATVEERRALKKQEGWD